jgi:hypothetical protein
MAPSWKLLRLAALVACGSLFATGVGAPTPAAGDPLAAAAAPAPQEAPLAEPPAVEDPSTVAPAERDEVLPEGWRTSADLAWTTSGDSSGFHLLVADSASGYTWRTAATLIEPGIEADSWVGNACITASGKRAVVVYEPRHFTNRAHLFGRGAFAAVVDLATGAVTKLGVGVTIAYYNPGCGAGETAVLTQSGAADLGRTQLQVLDAAAGRIVRHHELSGQVTSAVPFGQEIAAAEGGRIVGIDRAGDRRTLATTAGTAAYLRPDSGGGLAFLEHDGDGDSDDAAVARYLEGTSVREVARGPVRDIGLSAGVGGRVFVTGESVDVASLPGGLRRAAGPAQADLSTLGKVAVAHADDEVPGDAALRAEVLPTGETVEFLASPGDRLPALVDQGREPSPVFGATAPTDSSGFATLAAGSPLEPVEADRACSVSRNDVNNQVEQPHWKQVEWAADLAVQGALTIQRPANFRPGMSAWSPQVMFRPIPLAGGGRVPATVMLAILAQESNLWQASWHALEGVAGNPLIGMYYGSRTDWTINWGSADCGYGVAQVTDGMRLAGREKPGEVARPWNEQRAIAVDYATNIAAGVRILEEKWNQTYNANIRVNNADPSRPENWFAAVWAYNSGLNPQASTGNTTGCSPGPSCTDSRGAWGLGWGNNPANPDYRWNRGPFLEESPGDAAHPQDWPYPEKIMGWAAFPIIKADYRIPDTWEPGFRQAWWDSAANRTTVKPPRSTFCTTANNCVVSSSGPGSCGYADFHCWWHWPVTWKPDCGVTCGHDNIEYAPGSAEPARGTHYPPVCSRNGLPSDALVVDDQPDGVPIVRNDRCTTPFANQGQFALAFTGPDGGPYTSKIDFHQIGGGIDGHAWFAHARSQLDHLQHHVQVTGTWTLGRSWTNKWARVLVHIPHNAGQSQQARYQIDRGAGVAANQRFRTRSINQQQGGDRWVSLGVLQFNGTPKISLSNIDGNTVGTGVENVVWDAVAFQPLSAKPRNFVVAFGDSYSSGEGGSEGTPDYYYESDAPGRGVAYRNACHRSPYTWSRVAFLRDDTTRSIGQRADANDPNMDHHLLACSGAQSEHLLPTANDPSTGAPYRNAFGEAATGMYRQPSQLDQGFLDENTTLVTVSIGGNDAHFSDVIKVCMALAVCNELGTIDGHLMKDWIPHLLANEMETSVLTVLRAIRERAPNARIILMGYPELFSGDRSCAALPLPSPPGLLGITSGEADWINGMARNAAVALGDVARTANQTYGIQVRHADPIANLDFAGESVCGDPETIHGIILAKTPGEDPGAPVSSQSFHPKISGFQNYANTLNRELRNWGL